MSSLREENRKLRAETSAEIKLLQNKVLIAEEKSKAFLDQYSSTVAPLEAKKEIWKRELDEPSTYKPSVPYLFERPLSSTINTDRLSQPFHYDSSVYREPLPRASFIEQPLLTANIYESVPMKRYVDRDPSPAYRSTYEPQTYTSSYIGRSFLSSEKPLRPTSPAPSIRSYLDAEVSKSRDLGRTYLPKTRTGALHSTVSVGDDYLGRLSAVYPPPTSQLNSSFDRGSLRRQAVAEASRSSRPGESFLNEFRQKMQAINL